MQELANVLGRERVQLEFLLFKVLQLQHLLHSGDDRFLRWAGDEVLRASGHLRMSELKRSRLVLELALAAGVPQPDVNLATLAERSPEPWRTIFTDHSAGFRRLLAETDGVIRMTAALAESHGHAVADVLNEIHRPTLSLPGFSQFNAPESMVLP